jgi:hypothetical protein
MGAKLSVPQLSHYQNDHIHVGQPCMASTKLVSDHALHSIAFVGPADSPLADYHPQAGALHCIRYRRQP